MDGFPKVKYPQSSGGSIVVETPEQEKALGPGWVDHPPPAPKPAPEPQPEPKPMPKRREKPLKDDKIAAE